MRHVRAWICTLLWPLIIFSAFPQNRWNGIGWLTFDKCLTAIPTLCLFSHCFCATAKLTTCHIKSEIVDRNYSAVEDVFSLNDISTQMATVWYGLFCFYITHREMGHCVQFGVTNGVFLIRWIKQSHKGLHFEWIYRIYQCKHKLVLFVFVSLRIHPFYSNT